MTFLMDLRQDFRHIQVNFVLRNVHFWSVPHPE